MLQRTATIGHSFLVGLIVGAVVLVAFGARAQTGATVVAQATVTPQGTVTPTTSTNAAAEASRGKRPAIDGVDAQIKDLHRKLHITAAQEAPWSTVAQAMRDNAAAMDRLIQQRAAGAKTANAVDNLRSYTAMAEAHVDGLKKFLPALQTLYDSLSIEQRKIADAIFRNPDRGQPPTHG